MLKKIVLPIIIVLFVLAVGACSPDTGDDETPAPDAEPSESEDQGNVSDETGGESDSSGFVPSEPVPEGLPVYPDAVLTNDLPSFDGRWQWLYQTTGSGNDIMEFFVGAFEDLGFDIDPQFTFAEREEFVVTTADGVVEVYWLSSEESDLTPDSPDRGYGIVVLQERWTAP